MKKVFLLILFSIVVIGISAQGYTPKVGETIMFYPLTEKAKQKFKGYDCFYDVTKILPKNRKIVNDVYYDNSSKSKPVSYKFKKGYQFKCDKNGLTPFNEIEGKTFKVLKAESFMHKGKQENKVYLLFLSRVEDNLEIVLRVPFFEKETSELTKNLVCEKIEGYTYKTKYRYVNLPCIPINYMSEIKEKYKGEELFYKEKQIKDAIGTPDIDKQQVRKEIFSSISEDINLDIIGTKFDTEKVNKCMDIRFEECNISHYIHPYAICTYQCEEEKYLVKIPLTYIAGNTTYFNINAGSNYLFENFFVVKREEMNNIFKKELCLDIVNKYTGEDVYYGLDNQYSYDSESVNSKNNIKIKDGTNYKLIAGEIYKWLMFDVFLKKDGTDYDVFAILQDSLGVKFRVPAKKMFSGPEGRKYIFSDKYYNKDFQDYFMILKEANFEIEQRKLIKEHLENLAIKREAEEKAIYDLRVKKYGKSYADYMKDLTEEQSEKFERLAPKYGKATAKMMVEEKVRIGWSKQMCKESWGEPDDINKTIGSWGTHEQWVYGDIYCDYLYFENGVLTSIQN